MVTLEDIEEAADRLADLRAKFLKERGWTYTSQTPSHHWLWAKTLDNGLKVMVGSDTAMAMAEQEYISERALAETEAAERADNGRNTGGKSYR